MPSSDSESHERTHRSPRRRSPGNGRELRRHELSRERYRDNEDAGRRRSPRGHRDGNRDGREYHHKRRRERSYSLDADKRRRRSRDREDESRRRRHRDRAQREDNDQASTRYSRPRSRSRNRGEHRRSQDTRSRSLSPQAPVRSRGPLPSQNDAFNSTDGVKKEQPAPEKEKPNFGNTGRLAAESNTVTVNGGSVVLKYHEPPEARKPPTKDDWRLYVFRGEDLLEMVQLSERSCWLIGREKLVVDFPIEHPSCSKQHAVVQFRYVEKKNEYGDKTGHVRPYLIDLESANGSKVNGNLVPGGRYIELRDKDVLKFGQSSRDYVLMLSSE
ncbi:SMAD/FHA domain-containing protein [Talaromyces proteolyticus]|uniref:SMAD/FHA domain-containing protein n=1 Tax=Talaromyces proteolyticus TaxID=1131652 RepID=A0AAD4KJE3_9EURO|nr:SMAD/FHA domain-containing protein [Talaromyces proteolyticus]KAH8692636.1 SMAD/FHA domain-containing protein [Talaromyces proteolyticus]